MNTDYKNIFDIDTLGKLKASGYTPKSIKQEMRDNLINALKEKKNLFEGIFGFEDTVIPDIERAVLSCHDILLLGLRGQAKTRIARLMINLLDEYIPLVSGSEINDDPLDPISHFAKNMIRERGDETPVTWLHRSERYVEKLATPDVNVADLIGDVDPILAASLKLPYSDPRVIHFGLIPRSHRSLFVMNELPDLQARIQVALFNILQEKDIQIRGFKLRLPLDIEFIFTANPEDYTNRGSIITPLKDRIGSQILTHYPGSIDVSKKITLQEARLSETQRKIQVPEIVHNVLERIAISARESEFVDEKSGVSARLTINAYENLLATAERRMLINNETEGRVRISDLWGTIPAINGKIELEYEGEQEGPFEVAILLINTAIKEEFLEHFPDPEKANKRSAPADVYQPLKQWFSEGNSVQLFMDADEQAYQSALKEIDGLSHLVIDSGSGREDIYSYMELALHGLADFNIIHKEVLDGRVSFNDYLANMLDELDDN